MDYGYAVRISNDVIAGVAARARAAPRPVTAGITSLSCGKVHTQTARWMAQVSEKKEDAASCSTMYQ